MGSRTPLYEKHVDAGARIVDFGGWDMPLHYGSQKEEHHVVRKSAGMFDVSHMTIVDLSGERVREFLQYLLANDVAKLQDSGKALYTCMLNPEGGVIDDLIIYYISDTNYRMVVNAATRDKDLAWITKQSADFAVSVSERPELAMIAVQGPNARELAAPCIKTECRDAALAMKPFFGLQAGDWFIARTGYTGEDGWEICMPADEAHGVWDQLLAAGVVPCGLGARDTLRLEAAMNLYGTDMDETISPLEAGLNWTLPGSPPIVNSLAVVRLKHYVSPRTNSALSVCYWKIAECLEITKKSSLRALVKARLQAVVIRRPSANQSRWPECRRATTTVRRSKSEASC